MRVLLLTHRVKDYWSSSYGQSRVTRVISSDHLRARLHFQLPHFVWQLALSIYARAIASGYDVVVCVDRYLAQIFSLVKQTSGLATPVVAHQLILPDVDDPRRKKFVGYWDRKTISGIKRAIVNSSHEVQSYGQRFASPEKFAFIPIAVAPTVFNIESHIGNGPDIFTGGIAMRDYPTFFKAVRNTSYSVEAVVYKADEFQTTDVPPNVQARFGVLYNEFLLEMAAAQVVVIPLQTTQRSAGQGTIILAQALGKPVICSDVPTVRDYVAHDSNGWLVPPNDPEALRAAIAEFMGNEPLRQRIAAAARCHALENYTFAAYDERVGQVLNQAIGQSNEVR